MDLPADQEPANFDEAISLLSQFTNALGKIAFICGRDGERADVAETQGHQRSIQLMTRQLRVARASLQEALGVELLPLRPTPSDREKWSVKLDDTTLTESMLSRLEAAANSDSPFGPHRREYLESKLPMCSPRVATDAAIALSRLHWHLTERLPEHLMPHQTGFVLGVASAFPCLRDDAYGEMNEATRHVRRYATRKYGIGLPEYDWAEQRSRLDHVLDELDARTAADAHASASGRGKIAAAAELQGDLHRTAPPHPGAGSAPRF